MAGAEIMGALELERKFGYILTFNECALGQTKTVEFWHTMPMFSKSQTISLEINPTILLKLFMLPNVMRWVIIDHWYIEWLCAYIHKCHLELFVAAFSLLITNAPY